MNMIAQPSENTKLVLSEWQQECGKNTWLWNGGVIRGEGGNLNFLLIHISSIISQPLSFAPIVRLAGSFKSAIQTFLGFLEVLLVGIKQ